MGNWSLFTLAQWHWDQKKRKHLSLKPTKITIFGSFLDKDSIEFIYKFLNYQSYAFERAIPSIDIIFFPISKIKGKNDTLFDMLENLLLNYDGIEPNQRILDIVSQATWLQRRSMQFLFSRFEISKIDALTLFNRNKFLYGSLPALYLKEITQFPTIYIEGRVYNGIPLNFTIDQFIQSIIVPEILISSENITSLNQN